MTDDGTIDPMPDQDGHAPADAPLLNPADADAVDLLVDHGFDADRAAAARPELAERVRAAARLFGRLDQVPVSAPDPALVDATLARIAVAEREREDRMRIRPTAPARPFVHGRWREIVAVACVVLVAMSIVFPMLNGIRDMNGAARCADNMNQLASALDTYHGDFRSMPIAAGFGPDLSAFKSWNDYSGARNLSVLSDAGYCGPDCVACTNSASRGGYAMQAHSPKATHAWRGASRIPIVSDRNPVIDLTRRGTIVAQLTLNSEEHGGEGQNMLFTDGSVEFVRSPVLMLPAFGGLPAHEENLWLPMDLGGLEDDLDSPSEWLGIDVFLIQ